MPEHGSASTYSNHKCRCVPCTEAHRVYIAKKREEFRRHGGLSPDDPRHGSVNAYTNYYCRCYSCRTAQADHQRAYRANKMAEAA
jgi:hypothetical protein